MHIQLTNTKGEVTKLDLPEIDMSTIRVLVYHDKPYIFDITEWSKAAYRGPYPWREVGGLFIEHISTLAMRPGLPWPSVRPV